MRLARISMHGVPGLCDVAADLQRLPDAPARMVAISGPIGAGKTRLLDAIVAGKEAAAPYGSSPVADDWVSASLGSSKIVLDWWLDESERSYAGVVDGVLSTEAVFVKGKLPMTSADPGLAAVLKRYQHNETAAKVDYFPSDRGLPALSVAMGDIVFDQRRRRLTKGAVKYGVLHRFAFDLKRTDPAGWAELVELFARLARGRRLLGVGTGGRLELDTPGGGTVGIDRLSDAERMAFVFAATGIMVRLEGSVVLVDTPELHQPPSEAARMLRELASHFSSSQWIVATHDPNVLAMADVVIQAGGHSELLAAHG